MTGPPTLAALMADPGDLVASCLGCHHNTTMPVAALLSRYPAETPFPEVWGGFRCSVCESRRVDVRPHWAARQAGPEGPTVRDRTVAYFPHYRGAGSRAAAERSDVR